MTAVNVRCIRSFLSVACLGAGLSLLGVAIPAEAAADSAGSLTANLGSIDFPNSGATEAQTAFLTGMKALHSFEFEDAAEAFREAQSIDPDFALAHWGEALSYNHPLWAEQDREAAHAALARYAPTPQARAGKTPSARERGLMEAVDVLYGSGDKLSRDIAYSEAMQHLHLEAALAVARDDDDTAEKFLVEATTLEAELNAPSGPPLPMKPACLDDLVFLPANLSRLVIDPYREACKIGWRLGGGLDLDIPFFVTGFDAASEELKVAVDRGVVAAGAAYLGATRPGPKRPVVATVRAGTRRPESRRGRGGVPGRRARAPDADRPRACRAAPRPSPRLAP